MSALIKRARIPFLEISSPPLPWTRPPHEPFKSPNLLCPLSFLPLAPAALLVPCAPSPGSSPRQVPGPRAPQRLSSCRPHPLRRAPGGPRPRRPCLTCGARRRCSESNAGGPCGGRSGDPGPESRGGHSPAAARRQQKRALSLAPLRKSGEERG